MLIIGECKHIQHEQPSSGEKDDSGNCGGDSNDRGTKTEEYDDANESSQKTRRCRGQ